MANSSAPTRIQINYHSSFGLHKANLNARLWHDDDSAGGSGSVDDWMAGTVDVDSMVLALINELVNIMPVQSVFDNYIVYTFETPTSDPEPRAQKSVGAIPGAVVTPGWVAAVQTTMTWRTNEFGLAKLVMLDSASADDFSKIVDLTASAALAGIDTEFTATPNGWAGRDDARPQTFISQTKTLNEKLRRAYRLT